MQIGQLSKESEAALAEYKQYGFTTKTELVDVAIAELATRAKALRRKKLRESYVADYAATKPENIFEKLDGEDFE